MQVNIHQDHSQQPLSLMLLEPSHQLFPYNLYHLQDNNKAEKVDQLEDNADDFAEVE